MLGPSEVVPPPVKDNFDITLILKRSFKLLKDTTDISYGTHDVEPTTMKAGLTGWNTKTRNNEDFLAGEAEFRELLVTERKDESRMFQASLNTGKGIFRRVMGGYGPLANKILKSRFAERKLVIGLVQQCGCAYGVTLDTRGKRVCQSGSSGVEITRNSVQLCLEFKDKRFKEGKGGENKPLDSTAEQGDAEIERLVKTSRSLTLRAVARASSSRIHQGRPLRITGIEVILSTRTALSKSKVPKQHETRLEGYSDGGWNYVLRLLDKDANVRLHYNRQSCVVTDDIDLFKEFTLAILLELCIKREADQAGFDLLAVSRYVDPYILESEMTGVQHCDLLPRREDRPQVQPDIPRQGRDRTYQTSLYRGKAVHDVDAPWSTNKDLRLVVKSFWQVASLAQGHKMIAEARRTELKQGFGMFGQPVIINGSPSDEQREKCSRTSQEYEKNEIQVPVERKYKSISEIEDPEIFWKVLMQCVRCAHRLYSKDGVLLRDICINNLRFYIDENGEYFGVLIDTDLAPKGSTQKFYDVRCGSAPFMAREILDVSKEYTHRFCHELESFLYVAVWHALGYRQKKFPEQDTLYEWRKGSWNNIARVKKAFISVGWIDMFPTFSPDKNFLDTRCSSLCHYFFRVEQYLLDKSLSQWGNVFGVEPDRKLGGGETRHTKITFRRWLRQSGEPEDSDACYKDCCAS